VHQAPVSQRADRDARARIVAPELHRLAAFGTRDRDPKDTCRLGEAGGSLCGASGLNPLLEAQLLATGKDDLDRGLVESGDCDVDPLIDAVPLDVMPMAATFASASGWRRTV